MIITVAHQKGGTGKTSIATNLAVLFHADLLDLDHQHSSIIFNNSRIASVEDDGGGKEIIPCYTIQENGCTFPCQQPIPNRKLENFLQHYKGKDESMLIVDCGGHDTGNNRKALIITDYILTPVAPSPVEVDGLQKFEEILIAAERLGLHLRTHVVIDRANYRSLQKIRDMQRFIIDNPEHFILCNSIIGEREAFRTTFGYGIAVTEAHPKCKVNAKAAEEMTALAQEIQRTLEGGIADAV